MPEPRRPLQGYPNVTWGDTVATWGDIAWSWGGSPWFPLFIGGPADLDDHRPVWGRASTYDDRYRVVEEAAR